MPRHLVALLGLIAAIVILMAGCAPAPAPEPPPEPPPVEEPQEEPPPPGELQNGIDDPDPEWQALIARAQQEGRLVIQAVVNPDERVGLPRAFERDFGISVEYISLDSTAAAERAIRESEAGIMTFDIMTSGQSTFANQLYPHDILESLEPLLVHPALRNPDPEVWQKGGPWFMDADRDPPDSKVLRLLNYLTPMVQINLDEVPEGVITSADDLLDPQWQGRIAVHDPTVPGPGAAHVSIMMENKGEQFVIDLIDGQQAQRTRDRGQLADWLAEGRYPIAIGVPSRDIDRLNDEGFNVAAIELDDVPTPIGVGSGMLAMFRNAPNPNAAQLFVNWILLKGPYQEYVQWNLAAGTRTDLDLGHLAPINVPDPDVEYFDPAEWNYTVIHQAENFARLAEMFGR